MRWSGGEPTVQIHIRQEAVRIHHHLFGRRDDDLHGVPLLQRFPRSPSAQPSHPPGRAGSLEDRHRPQTPWASAACVAWGKVQPRKLAGCVFLISMNSR